MEVRGDRTQSILEIDNAQQPNDTNIVDWNVNMKLTLPNSKREKIFRRIRDSLVFILAIAFAILLSNVKKEVHALQVQVHCMNTNLVILMFKYDKLHRNFNRAWFQHLKDKSQRSPYNLDVQELPDNFFETSISDDELKSIETQHSSDPTNATSNLQKTGTQFPNTVTIMANRNGSSTNSNSKTSAMTKHNFNSHHLNDTEIGDYDEKEIVVRVERANLTNDEQSSISDERSRFKSYDTDDDQTSWTESRRSRSRRDDGRGKKRRKSQRRPKRSRRRLGPLVATFIGAVPEQQVTDTVYIGPWVKSTKNESQYNLNKFHLVEDKRSIEVTTSGLYMITTQIFYFGEHTHYSYWILLSSEGSSTTKKIAKCATDSTIPATEISCYTGVVMPLRRGDRLRLQQQERDRLINLRAGHSYIQLVLLSSDAQRRHPW
ncbi:uncharacterized protein LOC107264291 isoform X2 [Cephus cinctus]|uniref:Uncharacterized protein LOC107264291 isoform X2 n=1 Tax=Cephus cinctus TaxID=211228 RepID=A0AAJ7BJY0_CEPCN|nr:uncharacterized protein LOC107264291 isoform X2 [Cephus cinctus]